MSSDEAGARHDADPPDWDRRRAIALGAWATGVAVAGSVAARVRALAGSTSIETSLASSTIATRAPAAPPPAVAPSGVTAGEGDRALSTGGEALATLLEGEALVLHVARRTTFGPTSELLQEIRAAGVDAWLERQLAPATIDDDEVDDQLGRLQDLDRGPGDIRAMGRFGDEVLDDLRVAAIVRAARSARQLQEVMVDLWHDHLTASSAKTPVEWHLYAFDRDAIRPHALGRFTDLLQAVTRSSAMVEYLDTRASSAPDVNENHGRELLELHTVGRDAGFGPTDVIGAARVLSGWTLDPRTLSVTFDPDRHHSGPATVLGWSTPGHAGAAGAGDLDGMLGHLATHPATATRVASLLVERFVADEAPPELVASTASAYLAAGTDLAATLRHLFASTPFRSTSAPITRRPFDLFAAQLRAADADLDVPNLVERLLPVTTELEPLVGPLLDATGVVDPLAEPLARWALDRRPIATSVVQVLRANGQPLFAAPNPAGHPMAGASWTSGDALLRRWTLAARLGQDGLAGITTDPVALAGGATTAGDAVDVLARRCFGADASPGTRASTLTAMGMAGDEPVVAPQLRLALSFLLAAPEMQIR